MERSEFIDFMVESGVLTFGDFTTKSGRKTPYFVNTGRYRTGRQMHQLGAAYAAAIAEHFSGSFDVLFGPAYKGIPLVVLTAEALYRNHQLDVSFCFNRKEAKDHGEGGSLIGHTLADGDRVLFVEDVTTAGTSIRQTVPLLRAAAKVELAGLMISVDRMERGQGERSALSELSEEFRMPARSIATIDHVVSHLSSKGALSEERLAQIAAYRETYGAR